MHVKDLINRSVAVLRSRRGRNVLVFMVFLVIATFLWWVLALNEEGQIDVRLPIKLTHVPDSVTIVSSYPATMSVSFTARGSQSLKFGLGKKPDFNIDFRVYTEGSYLRLSDTDLRSIARNSLGGASIVVVYPDSLNIAFTSRAPLILPVSLDYTATAGPQAVLSGAPILSTDSVKVYYSGDHRPDVRSIRTEPIAFSDINENSSGRVKLIAPPHCRVIPDSVDVTVNVEPLIFKTRKVKIDTWNVPSDERLIVFPSQVDVRYLIAVSDYIDSEPHIKVVADYNSINPLTGKVRLKVAEASHNMQNIQIASDSAEFIIERSER